MVHTRHTASRHHADGRLYRNICVLTDATEISLIGVQAVLMKYFRHVPADALLLQSLATVSDLSETEAEQYNFIRTWSS